MMRVSAILMVLAFLGCSAVAVAEVALQSFEADKIEGGRILTVERTAVALYGVRMLEKARDPDSYKAAQKFLRDSFEVPRFQLDVSSFQEQGVGENRYGDLHGKILLANDLWLQEELIANGYGFWSGAANYPPNLRRILVRAEHVAEIKRLGLWQRFAIIDANRPPVQRWDGQFVIAQGVVQDVYRSASTTYLNFGQNWREDFTAAIPARSRKKFERQGWKLNDLKNKSITIRGLVRFYNGPYLELEFPEQLEIDEAAGEE